MAWMPSRCQKRIGSMDRRSADTLSRSASRPHPDKQFRANNFNGSAFFASELLEDGCDGFTFFLGAMQRRVLNRICNDQNSPCPVAQNWRLRERSVPLENAVPSAPSLQSDWKLSDPPRRRCAVQTTGEGTRYIAFAVRFGVLGSRFRVGSAKLLNSDSCLLTPDFLLLPTDTIPTQIALLRVRDVDT
jgi:hypothetical protein